MGFLLSLTAYIITAVVFAAGLLIAWAMVILTRHDDTRQRELFNSWKRGRQ